MSNIRIDDLSKELGVNEMAGIQGGTWDYSNRLGSLGQTLEDNRDHAVFPGGGGLTIEGAANAGDDSSYYPGLTPLR